MNAEEFDACFDRFEADVFRLETLQHYAVSEEDESFAAFRRGLPRPERSVRTSAWMRRIAVTTASGKSWQRVHVVELPLSEYLRYELIGYVESAAVGEEILIADRSAHPELADLGPDFWLFDAGTEHAYGVLMHYDEGGNVLGFDYTEDASTLDRCRAQREIAVQRAVSLNRFLVSGGIRQVA